MDYAKVVIEIVQNRLFPGSRILALSRKPGSGGQLMKWTRQWLGRLNSLQRLFAFLGVVFLLLSALYPEYETSHYIWLSPEWYRLGGTIKRAFVTDIRHGEIVKVLPAGDPELRRLVDFRDANDATFERRTAIRVPTVILQGLLVIALTLLAIWLMDEMRWGVNDGKPGGHFGTGNIGQGPGPRWHWTEPAGASRESQLVRERVIPDSYALNSPAPSIDEHGPADAPDGVRRGNTPRPQTPDPSLFHNLGTTRNRLPLIVAVGFALLIAIPFLMQVVIERQTPVADLTAGKTGAAAEPQTPRNSRGLPELVSNQPPEVTHGPPAKMSHTPVSLRNGTNLVPPQGSQGLGQLKIINHTGSDAAVKLKTSAGRTTVRFVYVQAMSDVTVAKIVPGEYIVQFATGRDWDASDLAFRKDRAFATFDKTLSFSEKHADDRTVYSTHEITLHTMPNGNVQKRVISAEEFSDDVDAGGNRRH